MRARPLALLLLLGACTSAARGETPNLPVFPRASTVQQPLPCGAAHSSVPDKGKRVEFRIAPSQDRHWVQVGDRGVFFHSSPEQEKGACFAVDLPTGGGPASYHVTYKVEAEHTDSGARPGLEVAEWGEKAGAFYGTFRLDCGGQACTKASFEEIADRHKAAARGVYDPCGSIRVKKLTRLADGMAKGSGGYPAVAFEFDLLVYAFKPQEAPGTGSCERKRMEAD